MTDIAIAVELDDERRLVESAALHGHRLVAVCSGADELAARIAATSPQTVVVTAAAQYLDARLVATCDEAAVRLIAIAAPDQQRLPRSLGLLDIVDAPFDWSALEPPGADAHGSVESGQHAAASPADAAYAARRPGTVIAVWGPNGSPGRTAIAIAITAELAAAGRSVALADADTHSAAIAPALGLLDEAPGFAAACRLAGAGGLDSAEFERIAQVHRSRAGSFPVLTGLGRPSRWPELSADRVRATIAAARDWVDFLVVDVASSIESDEELSSDLVVAPRRNAATTAALFSADHVIAVGAADPIGLSRFLRAHTELLDAAAPSALTTVINKVRSTAIGMNPGGQVRQTLLRFGGIDDPVLIPHDLAAFDAAVLAGRTLVEVAPHSAARAAIRDLVAQRIAPLPVSATPVRGRRRGIRGVVARSSAGATAAAG